MGTQFKKVYWPTGQRFIKLRISMRTIRTLDKIGLSMMATYTEINLWKLPFKDFRSMRLEYLRMKSSQISRPKKCQNNMKNIKRLANSRKKLVVPRYIGGRIFWIRFRDEENIYKLIHTKTKGDLKLKIILVAMQDKENDEN